MNRAAIFVLILSVAGLCTASAQPATVGPVPSRAPVEDALQRRLAYLDRVEQVIDWRAGGGRAKINDPATFDLAGIAASTGAACTSGSTQPSPVLLALGLAPGAAREGVRFSLGRSTTREELAIVVAQLTVIVERVRASATRTQLP